MMVSFISIYKVIPFDVTIKIHHQTIRVITKGMYNNRHSLNQFFCLCFGSWSNITALKNVAIKSLLIICVDENVQQYTLLLPV